MPQSSTVWLRVFVPSSLTHLRWILHSVENNGQSPIVFRFTWHLSVAISSLYIKNLMVEVLEFYPRNPLHQTALAEYLGSSVSA